MKKALAATLFVLLIAGVGIAFFALQGSDERAAGCGAEDLLTVGWKPRSNLETFVAVSGNSALFDKDMELNRDQRSTSEGQNIPGGLLCVTITSNEVQSCGEYSEHREYDTLDPNDLSGRTEFVPVGQPFDVQMQTTQVTANFYLQGETEPTSTRAWEVGDCPSRVEDQNATVRHQVTLSEILNGVPPL